MLISYSVKQFRPKYIKVLGFVFLFFPISFIFFVGVLFDIPLSILLKKFASPWFLIFNILGIVTGYALLEMKRWTWWLFLSVFTGMFFYSFMLLIHHGETHHKILSFLVEVCLFFILYYSLRREFLVPYIIPRVKWWENDSDQFFYCQVKMKGESGDEFTGDLLDINFKGCFIKSKDRIPLNDEVEISLNAFGQGLVCKGVVVWHAHSVVTHPRGLGVRFDGFDKRSKRVLTMFIHRLSRIQEIKKTGLKILNVDNFFRNLADLQSLNSRVINPPKVLPKKKLNLKFKKKEN